MRVQVWGLVVQVVPAFIVSTWWQVVQGAGASSVLRCVFRPFVLPFVPLLLLLSCICLEICLISHFKAVFRGFCGADVYLYGLRSLRGLWGFCVREWLGGFMACGVFCLYVILSFAFCFLLLSSCPAFASSPAWLPALPAFLLFVLFSWLCGLAFFPFRTIRKKKGRAVLVRPLLSCCGFVMQNKVFRSRKIRNR